MTVFTKSSLLFLVFTCSLFQSTLNAQSVMDPNDPIVSYPNGPNDPRPLPNPPPLPANSNVINKWLRGNVRLMTGPASAPLGYTWSADAYKAYIYKSQPFRLKFPRTYDPNAVDGKRYPMIIFFHGLGEVSYNCVPFPKQDSIPYFLEYDNEWHLLWGGDAPFLGAVNNPDPATGFDGYILYMQLLQYGWDVQQYNALKEICDYMVINNKLDPFAVSCTGLSGGALASWAMMTANPTLISGSVPMSGASMGVLNDIDKFKFTPVWLFQGGDDPAQDEQLTLQVVNGINAAGGRLTYTFIPGVGHNTWQPAFNYTDYIPFFKRAYAANPWPLFGKTNFVTGETIAVTIGVAPGFDSYEWRWNGVTIPGATTNTIFVSSPGIYDVRLIKNGVQSEWSRIPVSIFLNGSLPVNWKSFTGNLITGGINLNWVVDNNEKGKSYQIEHSTDGRNFSKVDEIANKPDVKSYSYIYKTAEAGHHYFRILQTDADGKSEYSKVVVISFKGDANYLVRLITNPVRVDFAELEINTTKQTKALIEIWSASGAKISNKQQQLAAGNTRIQVPLNGASAGIYLIKVQIGNAVVTEKFVKF